MSDVKERILGAVTVMTDNDAKKLWKIIIDNFALWNDIEEVVPDKTDKAMLKDIENDPDCQSFLSEHDAMKELGL